jgi:hypothetical protein
LVQGIRSSHAWKSGTVKVYIESLVLWRLASLGRYVLNIEILGIFEAEEREFLKGAEILHLENLKVTRCVFGHEA